MKCVVLKKIYAPRRKIYFAQQRKQLCLSFGLSPGLLYAVCTLILALISQIGSFVGDSFCLRAFTYSRRDRLIAHNIIPRMYALSDVQCNYAQKMTRSRAGRLARV